MKSYVITILQNKVSLLETENNAKSFKITELENKNLQLEERLKKIEEKLGI